MFHTHGVIPIKRTREGSPAWWTTVPPLRVCPVCWIGHKYPVPSSPPHAPRSGAHWPNGMEYFTPFSLETKWLLVWKSLIFSVSICTGSVFKCLSMHWHGLHWTKRKRTVPCPARAGGTGGTVVEPCRKPVRVKGLCRPKRARVEVRVQKPHTYIYIYTIYSRALERGTIGGHRRVFFKNPVIHISRKTQAVY